MNSYRILRHLMVLTDRQGVTIGTAYSLTAAHLGIPRIEVVNLYLRITNERWHARYGVAA